MKALFFLRNLSGNPFAILSERVPHIQSIFRSGVIVLFVFLCFSCKKNREDKQRSISERREKKLLDFAGRYHAVIGWDTLALDYTIEYNDIFPDTNTFALIDRAYISDVFKDGNKYFVSCNSFGSHGFYFNLECNRMQIDSITNHKSPLGISFIAKVKSIKKIDLSLISDFGDDLIDLGDESSEYFPTTRIFVAPTDDFVIEGKVVDLLIQ